MATSYKTGISWRSWRPRQNSFAWVRVACRFSLSDNSSPRRQPGAPGSRPKCSNMFDFFDWDFVSTARRSRRSSASPRSCRISWRRILPVTAWVDLEQTSPRASPNLLERKVVLLRRLGASPLVDTCRMLCRSVEIDFRDTVLFSLFNPFSITWLSVFVHQLNLLDLVVLLHVPGNIDKTYNPLTGNAMILNSRGLLACDYSR